jgi:GT2 family glycosyltransferase/glycosyltransferase involved in cell wall biosynthesis
MTVHFLAHHNAENAVSRYRCLNLIEQLKFAGIEARFSHRYGKGRIDVSEDVVVLNRLLHEPKLEGFIKELRAKGKAVVYSLDDLLFTYDWPYKEAIDGGGETWQQYTAFMERTRRAMLLCDCVIVSTELIAKRVEDFGMQAFVVRNVLSQEHWEVSLAASLRQETSEVVLGYASGSATHDRDLAGVSGALARVLGQHEDAVLQLIGPVALPKALEPYAGRVRRHSAVPWKDLPPLLSQVDINLAPLDAETTFNRAKSHIKWLEAAAVHTPTVASRTEEFESTVRNGENGFLAEGEEEWFSVLSRLIESPSRRSAVGEAAFRDAETQFRTESPNATLEVFEIIADKFANGSPGSASLKREPEALSLPAAAARRLIRYASRKLKGTPQASPSIDQLNEDYRAVFRRLWPGAKELEVQRRDCERWERKPSFTIIVDDENELTPVTEAMAAQSYPWWNVVGVGPGFSLDIEHALEGAGDFVWYVRDGMRPWPNALYEFARHSLANPESEVLFADFDRCVDGSHKDPWLHPSESPACMAARGCVVVLANVARSANDAFEEGSAKRTTMPKAARIPKILGSLNRDLHFGPAAFPRLQEQSGKVSIIIPTKDSPVYIKRCVESILGVSTHDDFEILLVDSGSTDRETLKLYEAWQGSDRVRVLNWDKPFNFSSVCNFGAAEAQGEYLLFLNNDTEVRTPGWMQAMLHESKKPGVGSVGAKLLYPDGTIQHAGIVTGVAGMAGHVMRFMPDVPQDLPMPGAKDVIREVSACTAACLMVRKETFERVGGFDERFRIAYNDVDLGLRLLAKEGLRNIYTPLAMLTHYEGVSVGRLDAGRDMEEFRKESMLLWRLWGDRLMNDPFYHPLLTKWREDFSLETGG